MRKTLYSLMALIAITTAGCDDSATTIGSSLIADQSEVVVDTEFTLTGQSVEAPAVQSRTTTQLLGLFDAKEFGKISSEFITQFMPTTAIDTLGVKVSDIDSVKLALIMAPGAFTGDSIVPMGLQVHKLLPDAKLPAPIYSDFDPTNIYEASVWASQIYSANTLHSDSLTALSKRTVYVDLPRQFGVDIYNEYLRNPSTFASPQAFAKFFPGIYVKNSFGAGRMINISETRINIHYRSHRKYSYRGELRDTVYNLVRTVMAVTPEVITDNIIHMKPSQQLDNDVAAGEAIITAPTGYDVSLNFPLPAIIDSYRRQSGSLAVVNNLTLEIPATTIINSYGINPPENILLILTSEKQNFFAKGIIPDNKIAFLATYDPVGKTYKFDSMRQYLLNMLAKETITADDYTFTVTAVDVVKEITSDGYGSQQSYITAVNPYISGPVMAKLNIKDAKIKLIFSNQSVKF